MIHRSTKSTIMVVDVALRFEDVYQKPYFAKEYIDEIKKANLLLLPSENIREGLEPVYPELAFEQYMYMKEHAPEGVKVDIAVDDAHFHKLVLHASSVAVATILLRADVLKEAADLVTGFLQETVKGNLRLDNETDTFVNMIVQGEDSCRKIMFAGRISELKDALSMVIQKEFR